MREFIVILSLPRRTRVVSTRGTQLATAQLKRDQIALSLIPTRGIVGQKLAAPAHKNDAYEAVLYGIEGVLTWTVDGTPTEVGPGQALCIPRGAVHRFDNLGNEDARQLAVISPAVMGPAYFREAAQVINAVAAGPPDRAKMMDIFRRQIPATRREVLQGCS